MAHELYNRHSLQIEVIEKLSLFEKSGWANSYRMLVQQPGTLSTCIKLSLI